MNSIDLSWLNKETKKIHTILKDIKEKESILCINLEGNFLVSKGLKNLMKYITLHFKNIIHLNLSDTNISIQELFIISKELLNLKELKSLSLNSNIISGKSISYISKLLPTLYELSLNSNFLSLKGIRYLSYEFKNMKNLKYLSLRNCNLYSEELFILSEDISYLENLEHLSLSGNFCNITILSYLLLHIPKKKMIYLDLGDICGNLKVDYGIYNLKLQYTSFLSSQLELFKNLEVLVWNMYYDNHIMYGIGKLKKLEKLILNIVPPFFNNHISYFPYLPRLELLEISCIGYNTLLKVLENLPISIKHLYLKYISIDFRITRILSFYLFQFKNLCSFSFDNSFLKYTNVEKICSSLKNAVHLSYLSFYYNSIDDKTLQPIIELLLHSKNLEYLSLQKNNISILGLEKIINILKYCKKKKSIFLKHNFFSVYQYPLFLKEKEEILDINKKLNEIWILEIKEEYKKIRRYKPFYHFIDSFCSKKNEIEEYNKTLIYTQERIKEKINYYLFSNYIEKTKSNHDIFYNYDIKNYIYTFL